MDSNKEIVAVMATVIEKLLRELGRNEVQLSEDESLILYREAMTSRFRWQPPIVIESGFPMLDPFAKKIRIRLRDPMPERTAGRKIDLS